MIAPEANDPPVATDAAQSNQLHSTAQVAGGVGEDAAVDADRSVSLNVLEPLRSTAPVVALVGNPNAGKTTIFNKWTGLRAGTANFPGTTVEHREASLTLGSEKVNLIDLPGLYSITGATSEERVSRDLLAGELPRVAKPAVAVVVVDATNLERNLYLVSQVLELNVPVVVALNMMDLAQRLGLKINAATLSLELGCPVIETAARKGTGLDDLKEALADMLFRESSCGGAPTALTSACSCSDCPYTGRFNWAQSVSDAVVNKENIKRDKRTEKLDAILTHPIAGVLGFFAIMIGVFWLIFSMASVPMDLIDNGFGTLGQWVGGVLPEGDLNSLVVNGIIGGVGGVMVFLPQIMILFFCLSLLEDTGYLARAAFVMDRLMRRVGLPGKAFVPMLSAHACAIPGIMAARSIENKRDRLVTILTIPLLTCSARLPVYTMIVALLFGQEPLKAAILFGAAYSLGIFAVLGVALALKKSVLPGETSPLVIELPSYKRPSFKGAALMSLDRAKIFAKKAGTVILVISIILWTLSTYPKAPLLPEVAQMQQQVESLEAQNMTEQAEALQAQASGLESRNALEYSAAGRIGKFIEPVITPLGFDWKIGIGVMTSFAAREVVVSTLSIVYGVGGDVESDDPSLIRSLRNATDPQGKPIFDTATCMSLLVFFVLAMQCLPTQAITRRETGTWKWAAFQLAYMTVMAYTASLITYQVVSRLMA